MEATILWKCGMVSIATIVLGSLCLMNAFFLTWRVGIREAGVPRDATAPGVLDVVIGSWLIAIGVACGSLSVWQPRGWHARETELLALGVLVAGLMAMALHWYVVLRALTNGGPTRTGPRLKARDAPAEGVRGSRHGPWGSRAVVPAQNFGAPPSRTCPKCSYALDMPGLAVCPRCGTEIPPQTVAGAG